MDQKYRIYIDSRYPRVLAWKDLVGRVSRGYIGDNILMALRYKQSFGVYPCIGAVSKERQTAVVARGMHCDTSILIRGADSMSGILNGLGGAGKLLSILNLCIVDAEDKDNEFYLSKEMIDAVMIDTMMGIRHDADLSELSLARGILRPEDSAKVQAHTKNSPEKSQVEHLESDDMTRSDYLYHIQKLTREERSALREHEEKLGNREKVEMIDTFSEMADIF